MNEEAFDPPFPIPRVPVKRFVPIEVVATTDPFAFTERSEFPREEMAKAVVVARPNPRLPEKVLLSERSVEDAAVTFIFEVPLNETPLIVRAFWSAVAVPALPETEPVIVLENVFVPANVLLSARRVDVAALSVMLPVPSKDTPLIVRAFWRAVAVPALPDTAPVMSDEKVFVPEKVLLFASRVDDAAVMVPFPPREIEVPLTVRLELVSPALLRVPVSVGVPKVKVPPEFVIVCDTVSPLKELAEEVANVIAPFCAVPKDCAIEVTPVDGVR